MDSQWQLLCILEPLVLCISIGKVQCHNDSYTSANSLYLHVCVLVCILSRQPLR